MGTTGAGVHHAAHEAEARPRALQLLDELLRGELRLGLLLLLLASDGVEQRGDVELGLLRGMLLLLTACKAVGRGPGNQQSALRLALPSPASQRHA